MVTGTVKWFNNSKGFGYVSADGGKEEIFAHVSEIKMDGFKCLKEGQRVKFEITQGTRGKEASNIQVA